MNIKTKFNVGDILKFKYDKNTPDVKYLLSVVDILTQTCIAGTQVFYYVRSIKLEFITHKYDKDFEPRWVCHYDLGNNNKNLYKKFREDEVIKASKEEIEILNSNK